MSTESLNRLQFGTDLNGGFSNNRAQGAMPMPLPQPLHLNLGCGNDVRDGFVNIDLFSNDTRVVYGDVRKLELPDASADTILASDILEHFSHRQVDDILKEWARVLKPNGNLIIRCPSLKLQAKAYLSGAWNADIASYMIFGGQTNPGDYHCAGFDDKSIAEKLVNSGFEVIEIIDEDYPQDKGFINLNMTVRAKRTATRQIIFPEPTVTFKPAIVPDPEPTVAEDNNEYYDVDLLEEIAFTDNRSSSHKDFPIYQSKSNSFENFPQANIVWEGSQFVYHSLALINREICSNLIESETANVTIIPYENDAFFDENNPKYKKLKDNDIRFKPDVPDEIGKLPYIWIRHQWPPKDEPPKGAKWVIMQPWEYSTLPVNFVNIFRSADEIWTPSTYSRKCFVDSGVENDKVQVIPNGIDPVLFSPKGNKYNLPTSKKMKFLFVGGTIFRKGIDVLLDAYTNTFTREDDVCLVVKDMGGNSFYNGQTAAARIHEIQANQAMPEIIYIDNELSEDEIVSLYRACDVFVSPYRGEGFSLPTLEAMACGLPVVVTKGGATDDFVDDTCGWFVEAGLTSVGTTIDGKPMTGEAFVLEPSRESLMAILKRLASAPTSIFAAGVMAQYKARKFWTWRRSALKALTRMDAFYNTNMAVLADRKLASYNDEYIEYGFAEKLFFQGDFNNAEKGFLTSIKIEGMPLNYYVHALNRLAQIKMGLAQHDDAAMLLEKSYGLNPNNPDSRYLKAILLLETGKATEAFEELTEVFENWTTNKYNATCGYTLDDILVFAGDILRLEGDLVSAHQMYTAALKVDNENPAACYGAAMCFREAGLDDRAKTMLEWAVKLDPDFAEAISELEAINEIAGE